MCDPGLVLELLTSYNYFCWYSPTSFDIDTRQLTQRYKELQWKLHPDKFSDLSKVLPMTLTNKADHKIFDKIISIWLISIYNL